MLACIVLAFSLGMVSGQTYPETADWALPSGSMCASTTRQSPIDLPDNMTATVHSEIRYKNYFNGNYNKRYKGLLVGEDCKVRWYINHKDKMKVHGAEKWRTHSPNIRDGPFGGIPRTHAYYLWFVSFHWGSLADPSKGSEHSVGGMKYALEMHMVHIEDEFIGADGTIDFARAVQDPLGIAVLAVFFKVVPKKPQNMQQLSKVDDQIHTWGKRSAEETVEDELEHEHNLNMRSLIDGFSKIAEAKTSRQKRQLSPAKEHKLKLNIGAFIRKATHNGADKTMSTYWTYKGSLTTPNCNEVVTWVVFERALHIAQVQANAFIAATGCHDTFRGTKPTTDAHMVQYLIHKPIQTKG